MQKFIFLFGILIIQHSVYCQSSKINSKLFFLDEHLIEVTLKTDIKNLRKEKSKPAYQPAKITMKFSDTLSITEDIRVQPRGEYRKRNCDLAALMLNFKNSSSPRLSPLKKIKLVGGCRDGSLYDDLLLKEYLVYKIQNMLSNMSFRVRLLLITYEDSREKVKPITQYAFLMEDMDDLAARNNCKEIKNKNLYSEVTEREQMTFVNLFQYMMGNTDWSIPSLHNMKLMVPKTDTVGRPYAIPYDYDYCGFVNAGYAVPAEALGIESVRTRLYRGFPRGHDELVKAIAVFNEKKESIFSYIENFEFCSDKSKKSMLRYLDDFYETINDKNSIDREFIRNARSS